MAIEFSWLTDIFAGFYDFFVGIAVFLNQTPADIFDLAEGAGFTYEWFNPFLGEFVQGLHRNGPVTDAILLWLPFQDKALWYNILVIIPTMFVSWFVIKGIIDFIKGVV